MHDITNALNYFANLPSSYYLTVLKYLGGATGLAVIVQGLKRKYKLDTVEVKLLGFIKLDGPKVMVALTGTLTAIASASQYLLSHATGSPLPIIASEWAKLLAVATVVHRFAVSPASNKIENTVSSLVKDAAAYRAEQSTKEPVPTTDNQFTV
jgi:hypothetical protein